MKKNTTQPPPDDAPPGNPKPSIPEMRQEDHPATPDGGFDHEIEITDDGEPGNGSVSPPEGRFLASTAPNASAAQTHSIPVAVRDDDVAFGLAELERLERIASAPPDATDTAHATPEVPARPDHRTEADGPISHGVRNPGEEMELLRAQLKEMELLRKNAEAQANEIEMLRLQAKDAEETRRRIVEMDSVGENLAKIPTLKTQDYDKGITETLQSAVTGNHPPPEEIPFDPKNLDGACIDLLRQYEGAEALCQKYALNAAGLGAFYSWRRGQFYQKVKDQLGPKGKWTQWYTYHKIDDSKISRDRNLFLAYPDPALLLGLSATAARNKIVKKLKDNRPPPPKPDPDARFLPYRPAQSVHGQETHEGKEGTPNEEEPSLGVLGVLEIGPGAVAKAEADAFCSVSAVDRIRKLMVCGRWDRHAKEAASRGIAVLVLPELQGGRP